ncbi:MAG: tRNA 2-thiouridine synthesizing protein C [Candidatus Azotimanducaceae bacterium]|jgi:tRNA 2-thiouridine synthesizing protein C
MTQLLFIQQTAPHGSIVGQEGLDACLMGSAFADCALLFLGDGIFQVSGTQNTQLLGVKDYSVSYGVLPDYGVSKIYCRDQDLKDRGLVLADLSMSLEALSDSAIAQLVEDAAQVLTF